MSERRVHMGRAGGWVLCALFSTVCALGAGCGGATDLRLQVPDKGAAAAPTAAPDGWSAPEVPADLAKFAEVPKAVLLPGSDLRFPHLTHAEAGLGCTDCHAGAATTAKAGRPTKATCLDCHEGIEKTKPRAKSCRTCHARADLAVRWKRPTSYQGVRFDHGKHAKKKVACATCHGDVAGAANRKALSPLPQMGRCVQCHERSGASTRCETCHADGRAKTKPASHAVGSWRSGHGAVWAKTSAQAKGSSARCDLCHTAASCRACHEETKPAGHAASTWKGEHGKEVAASDEAGTSCALCHTRESCRECHEKTPPRSHKTSGWQLAHGSEAMMSADASGSPVSCRVCHQETSCDQCHQRTAPRDHANNWRRFGHGAEASLDRDRCVVCHQADSCARCHNKTAPTSHTASFTRGSSPTHCGSCHQPLALNRCAACHRRAAHQSAPSRPRNARHAGATEAGCRTCHAGLRHPDNGDSCRSCHL